MLNLFDRIDFQKIGETQQLVNIVIEDQLVLLQLSKRQPSIYAQFSWIDRKSGNFIVESRVLDVEVYIIAQRMEGIQSDYRPRFVQFEFGICSHLPLCNIHSFFWIQFIDL
jgi:hypothetical protein